MHLGFDRDRVSWQLPPLVGIASLRPETEYPVANPEWGTKRICQNCGTKFYDLKREPIICPKCQSEYDPEAFLKTRRSRTVVGGAEKEASPVLAAEDPEAEIDDAEVIDPAAETADEEDEDMIEDASELGEDDDDMAEVIENVDDEEER
jgi:uncharacterized protein (TIGR02300 family)